MTYSVKIKGEFEDLGFKDFNDLLLKLEVTEKCALPPWRVENAELN